MQTSIEWLINQVEDNMGDIPPEIKEQAKQMEKDQIEESWNDGNLLGRNGHVLLEYSTGEEYYNETYGKDLPELRYRDGSPMRKYNSPKLQEMVDLMNEPEISDEEILKESNRIHGAMSIGFEEGAKWYREQLKKKQL